MRVISTLPSPHYDSRLCSFTMPFKRMQRNARPSDAYNDGSAVIPTGPERLGSMDTASNEHSIPQQVLRTSAYGWFQTTTELSNIADHVPTLHSGACELTGKNYHRKLLAELILFLVTCTGTNIACKVREHVTLCFEWSKDTVRHPISLMLWDWCRKNRSTSSKQQAARAPVRQFYASMDPVALTR